MHFVCVVNTVMSHERPEDVHSAEVCWRWWGKEIDLGTQQTIQPNAEQTHTRATQAAYKPAAQYDIRPPVIQVPYRSTHRTNMIQNFCFHMRGNIDIFHFWLLQYHKADFNLSEHIMHGGRSKTGQNNFKE